MGKKTKTDKTKKSKYPYVSVCTPTFNRRPFIPSMINCFDSQTYPKDRIEWIIIDDGTDKIEELVIDHPNVKYFKYDDKMTLGKKRNMMHDKSSGDIIVYMDDDDYYPPTRIAHAVEMLQKNRHALCAGSSELYIWFKHLKQMYQFGPYGQKHATAGTFAFKRALLKHTKYNETACLAEEKEFLKDYTIPFVQLDPKQTILVFSHVHNTFDKKKLLQNPNPKYVRISDKSVNDFIKNDDEIKQFFMVDIDEKLRQYEPGEPSMKPDVIQQTKEIEDRRRARAPKQDGQIMVQHPTKGKVPVSSEQILQILKQQQEAITLKDKEITALKAQIEEMTCTVSTLKQPPVLLETT